MFIDNDTVAICMATYNGEAFLAEQVESLLRQSYQNWVLFVRDDGSVDRTPDVIRFYAGKHKDKIVMLDDPILIGGSARKNFASILAWVTQHYSFRYYMFADQDDIWLEHKIEDSLWMIKSYESNGDIPVLVHTDLTVVGRDLSVLGESFFKYRALNPLVTDIGHLLVQNNVTGCTMLWNSALNDLIDHSMDTAVMHDWWVALTASCFGKIVCLDKSTILYRQHDNNVVGAIRANTFGFILKRLIGQAHVREALYDAVEQAAAFLVKHEQCLSQDQQKKLRAFSSLYDHCKLVRLAIVIREGFLKQAPVQIIGELLFL